MWHLVEAMGTWGSDPDDPEELARAKRFLVLTCVSIIVLASTWVALYWAYDEPLAAAIPGSYMALSAVSLVAFARSGRFAWFRDGQLFLMMVLPHVLQFVLGGFIVGSAVVLWSLVVPLGALVFTGPRAAVGWFAGYLGLLLASGLAQGLRPAGNNLPDTVLLTFFVLNLGAVSLVVFLLLRLFVQQLNLERARSERLLLNVLPAPVAARLRERPEHVIADRIESASVLFADVVGFTSLSASVSPERLVSALDEVFSAFDAMADHHGVEKIKTIGDSYMAAAGVPTRRPDHAHAIADLALAIRDYCDTHPLVAEWPLRVRIGINSGPVVAGVIGRRKFSYDLWGDTVNTASRMESHSEPGQIQLTDATRRLLRDDYLCQPRGLVEVKGKGPMTTWFLLGRRP